MISYLFLYFFQQKDEDIKFELTLDVIIFSAFTEAALFMAYVSFVGMPGGGLNIMLAVLCAVYLNVTLWIDLLTGYVYTILNQAVFVLLVLTGIFSAQITIISVCIFFLFILMVVLCEKIKAYSHGDSEFLIVSYLFFEINPHYDLSIEWMFLVMILGSVFFGIFRKITGRKEGMIPYTPFLVFSEFIIILFLAVMPEGKEVYAII